MSSRVVKIVLGSRSPRRRELLTLLVGPETVEVCPPTNPDEPGFEGCSSLHHIHARLLQVASGKLQQVREQTNDDQAVIVVADTVVVGRETNGSMHVLGQPPDGDWKPVVAEWFTRFYLGKSHEVVTGVVVSKGDVAWSSVVTSEVRFRENAASLVPWYLSTGESLGKAGGYAIQGAGGIFVEQVLGSLTNIVGLPLIETRELLARVGVAACQ